MRHHPVRNLLWITSVGLLAASVTLEVATPFPFYVMDWQSKYPSSMTDDNVIAGTGSGCQICHQDSNGGDGWNAYGWKVREEILVSGDIDLALTLAEPVDSDGDPTASSNLSEIHSDTQPGWTPGPENTIYFSNGSTLTDQVPPAAILGDLDPPAIGSNYCGPAVSNSTGQPAAITAVGTAVVADNDLRLAASSLPGGQFGYFLASQAQGFVQNPGGSDGNLCLGSPIVRLLPPVLNSGTVGTFALQLDLTNIPQVGAIQAGETWNCQAWFRDNNPGPTSNFTDGVSITFL